MLVLPFGLKINIHLLQFSRSWALRKKYCLRQKSQDFPINPPSILGTLHKQICPGVGFIQYVDFADWLLSNAHLSFPHVSL